MKYRSVACLILVSPALLLFLTAAKAQGYENHGVLSLEDYYFKDESMGYKTHFLTTRLKLDTSKLGKKERYGFHFDGRDREDLGSTRASTTGQRRVNVLNLDYKGEKYYFAAGRLWPKEFPTELVDGVNLVYQSARAFGVGGFGGLKPDPYTTEFTNKYTTAGLYSFYYKDDISASLAYTYNGYRGKIDRQYLYGQTSFGFLKTINLYGTLTMDISPTGKFSFTNGIAELSYRPDYKKSLSIGYNQFRTMKLYRSIDYAVDDSRQHAVYLSGNYRLAERYNLYGRVERQSRRVPSAGTQTRVDSYQAGVNVDSILKTGVNLDLSYSAYKGGGSRHNYYKLEFSRLNWEMLQLMVRAGYTQNRYALSGNDDILSYGMSAYLYLSKLWNFSLNYDREEGDSFTSNNLLSRISYKF